MKNEQLHFDTPESGRRLPIEGRPFAIVMAELASEGYTRIVR